MSGTASGSQSPALGLRRPGDPAPEYEADAPGPPLLPALSLDASREPVLAAAPGAQTAVAEAAADGAREPLVRGATRQGRRVATLRRIDVGSECIVECDVYPLNSLKVEPTRPGPYRFSRQQEGDQFVDEAIRALQYLGCDIS